MRFFAELSYNGAAYNGWQRQPSEPSIQQTVEEALSLLLREPVSVTGAGRTDTGVHAYYYVLHFDLPVQKVMDDDFIYHLNCVLPKDIAFHSIRQVAAEAHARFDALVREYTYVISVRKDPFRAGLCWQLTTPLDLGSMNRAAEYLLRADDFTTFSKLHSNNKTNICRVSHARWCREGERLIFTIHADRFLRNMVRSIVGTLVDVGRGKITPAEFGAALSSADRSRASGSAPSAGLFLSDIIYPDSILKSNKT